jgi:hypothetical protein
MIQRLILSKGVLLVLFTSVLNHSINPLSNLVSIPAVGFPMPLAFCLPHA